MITMTTQLADQKITPVKKTLRQQVYDFIKGQGDNGATDEEVQIALNMNPSTVRPRRIELEKSGRVEVTTEMRKTKSGRLAMVWKAA